MTYAKISPLTYRRSDGTFWLRPVIDGKRTWRKLASLTSKDAIAESQALLSDQKRSALGLAKNPFAPKVKSWGDLADFYLTAKCPDKRGKERPEKFCETQAKHIEWMKKFFGSHPIDSITIPSCFDYARWRMARITKGTGSRQVDIELSTLSNTLNHAVMHRLIAYNAIRSRARVHSSTQVRHCREVMPTDGDQVTVIARRLFADPRSQAIGWQFLFELMTGCRTNEVLTWKMDAKSKSDAGWVEGNYLYVRRSKRGVFPYVHIHPDLRELIACHHRWHADTHPESAYWFPGRSKFLPLDKGSLTHRLKAICEELHIQHITSHGLRAYCVTYFRSRGESNEQVASRIGDVTSGLIESVYGALPEVWAGGEPLTFRPRTGDPAWAPWLSPSVEPLLKAM